MMAPMLTVLQIAGRMVVFCLRLGAGLALNSLLGTLLWRARPLFQSN